MRRATGTEGADDVLARVKPAERAEALEELGRNAELQERPDEEGKSRRRVRARRASEMTMRATEWLWEHDGAHWLPLGGLSLLGGREGVGKSTWAYRLAAEITNGTLPGTYKGEPRSVVVSATEDAWEQTIVPRLVAAGADLTRVWRVDAEVPEGYTTGVTLPTDMADLERLCRQEAVALILLDPLMGVVSGDLDTHKDAEVRRALEPLSRLAHDAQLSVLGLIHQNKSTSGDLLTRLMGSRAFSAVARSVLIAAREDPLTRDQVMGVAGVEPVANGVDTFLFGQAKSNLGARVPFTIRYTIEGVRVGRDEERERDIWSSAIRELGQVEERVDELVGKQEAAKVRTDTAQDHAATWLRSYLDGHGPTLKADVVEAAAQRGIAVATLERARVLAGVQTTGRGKPATWSLPSEGTDVTDVTDVSDGTEGTVREGVTSVPSVPSDPPRARGNLREPPEISDADASAAFA